MSCSPGEPTEWSVVHALAAKVDALAVTLHTPGYSELLNMADKPFKFPSTIPIGTKSVCFRTNLGTASVIDQFLAIGLENPNAYQLPDETLETLALQDNLYVIVGADGCHCKSIYKISQANPWKLEEITDQKMINCCQSIYVPQVGDELGYGQQFIPAGWMAYFVARGYNQGYTEREKCYAVEGGAGFYFEPSGADEAGAIVGAARQLDDCVLTWPVRATWMDDIWDALLAILQCAANDGSTGNVIDYVAADGDIHYIDVGCHVSVSDIIMNLLHNGDIEADPGCLTQGVDWDDTEPDLPWEQLTCGGQSCDGNGPKFYCKTIDHMEAIIDFAAANIEPYSGRGSCCCAPVVEWRSKQGSAAYCPYFTGEGWATGGTATYECRLRSIEDPSVIVESCEWIGQSFTQEVYVDLYKSECPVTVLGEPCADYCWLEEWIVGGDIFPAGPPDWSALSNLAKSSAKDRTDWINGLGPEQGATYFMNPPFLGDAYGRPDGYDAQATYVEAQWRITLTPKKNHHKAQPSIVVSVLVYLYYNNEPITVTTRQVRCNWDDNLGRYVSAWRACADVTLAGPDESFHYKVEVDLGSDATQVKC